MNVKEIPINKIKVIENCRTGVGDNEIAPLMRSIRQHGLEQPIGVAKNGDSNYHLLYGHRRLIAFTKLGYKTIPAVINDHKDTTDSLILNLIENIQRVDISPQELGRVCRELLKLGLNKEEISARLDTPITKINTALDLIGAISPKFLNKVRFSAAPGTRVKGSIPAHVANEVVNIKRSCSLTRPQVEKLMEAIHQKELSTDEMKIVGYFIKDGYSVKDSLGKAESYMVARVEFTIEREAMEKLKEKHNEPLAKILRKIIYGELPSIKRPNFSD